MSDGFDKKFSKALDKMPVSSEETLNTIWEEIEKRIDFDKKKVVRKYEPKGNVKNTRLRKKMAIGLSASIAVLLLISLSLTVTPVKGMVNQIINFFGMNKSQDYFTDKNGSSKVEAQIYQSKLGYITYYDKDYFNVTKTEESDRFVPKTDDGEGSGQSFFEVKLIKNTTVQKAADTVVEAFKLNHSIVKVADNSDKKNYSYMYNPLEGINIRGFDSELVGGRALKNGSYYDFCSIAVLNGIGTVKISYRYRVNDIDTSLRLEKLYNDIIFVSNKLINQGPNILVFQYDHSKYKLIKIRGEEYTYLVPIDKDDYDPGILSFGHFFNKNIQKAAEAYMADHMCEVQTSDIGLKSIMLTSKNRKIYFIDDGQGGVYDFSYDILSNNETEKMAKSIRLIPLKGNEDLMKAKEIKPMGLG